jgi:hypothetical protein
MQRWLGIPEVYNLQQHKENRKSHFLFISLNMQIKHLSLPN